MPHFRRDVSRRLFTHVACRAHLCPSNYIRPLQPKVGVRSRIRERKNENVILIEAGGLSDLVLHVNMNSSSLSGSVQVGALGSLATAFASLSAACSRASLRCRPRVKGISPTSRHFLKKQVMAVVRFMPISSKNSSASAFKSLSMRMVNVVVMATAPFCRSNECIVSQSACNVNGVCDNIYRRAA